MPNLSAGEGKASEARGEDTVTPYPSMEMGEDYYGFCDRSSTDSEATYAIWVIVDRLTKSAHFLPVNVEDSFENLAKLYVDEIVRLHGVPVSILSYRDPRFTSRFWPSFQTALGTRLHFSTAFHPHMDGQFERTIQTLEDMLKACVMEFKGSWDTHLALM